MTTKHKPPALLRHLLAVVVDNERGILARISGMFAARGYNIESLTVHEVDAVRAISRITIECYATPDKVEQIQMQLQRQIPVHKTWVVGEGKGNCFERESVLVRLMTEDASARMDALTLSLAFKAETVEMVPGSVLFALSASPGRISEFVTALKTFGPLEHVRSGPVAMDAAPATNDEIPDSVGVSSG